MPQEITEQIEETPPQVTEDVQAPVETSMQTTPSPNKNDPSTPILSISTDDSDDSIPIKLLKRKKKQIETPPKRRRTRASIKAAAISTTAPILKKVSRKRIPEFSASLPRRRTRSSITAKSPSPTLPSSPPIMLRIRTPTSPEHSPSSPSGAEMQSVHNFVTLFSEAAVT